MRHAINNLQATHSGMGTVNGDNVFRVVDQPHPIIIKSILDAAAANDLKTAINGLEGLWSHGYSAIDIISTIFRVCKNLEIDESRKLKFIKVCCILRYAQHTDAACCVVLLTPAV